MQCLHNAIILMNTSSLPMKEYLISHIRQSLEYGHQCRDPSLMVSISSSSITKLTNCPNETWLLFLFTRLWFNTSFMNSWFLFTTNLSSYADANRSNGWRIKTNVNSLDLERILLSDPGSKTRDRVGLRSSLKISFCISLLSIKPWAEIKYKCLFHYLVFLL